MWSLHATRAFLKSAKKLPIDVEKRVDEFIERHRDGIEDPRALSNLTKLSGFDRFYRLRIGRFRVGLELDENGHRVILRHVGGRGDFYKRFPPR